MNFFGRHKKICLLLLILLVLVVGWLGYCKVTANRMPKIADLTFIKVKRGDIENTISAVGNIEPLEYVDLGSQVSGRIVKLHADLNDKVTKGQLLAEIDDSLYKAQLDSSKAVLSNLQAQLKQVEAELKLAKLQYERAKKLYANKAISREKLEDTDATYRVNLAKIEALKAQIRQAKSSIETDMTNLGYTRIYATMDGTVTDLPVKEGQTINANQSTPVIMQIAQLDKMSIKAEVSEADIASIYPGMPVYFTVLGNDTRKWYSTVRRIEPTPTVESDVVLYYVLFDVDNTDNYLRIQMSTQAFFVLEKAENTLLVAREQLDKQGRVCMVENDTIIHKEFEKGISNRFQVEVKSGLKEGDEIATVCRDTGSTNNRSKKTKKS